MTNHSNKSTLSRRSQILEELEEKGKVTVKELSEKYAISEVTVRNDLAQLEKQNMLIRARGGAIRLKLHHIGISPENIQKHKEYLKEKQRIALAAVKLINDGDTIILGPGSTTTEIAKKLGHFNNLTIITNALNIAGILSGYKGVNLYMPGGYLHKRSLFFAGGLADENFKKFFCNKLFIGAEGFDTGYGLSTPDSDEARLNQIMFSISGKVIVVADSRKFGVRCFAYIAPFTEVDTVITDADISEEDRIRLEKSQVEVIIA